MKSLQESLQNLISSSTCDGLCRYYNNLWGSYTNTNMSKPEDDPKCLYHITGHITGDCEWFADFLKGTTAPGAVFTELPESWENVMKNYGLVAIVHKDIRGIPCVCIIEPDENHQEPGIYCEC